MHKTQGGAFTPIPENYWRVVTHDKMDFPLYTFNTLTVALLAVIGTVISCSLAAYGFARVAFRGRGALFALMLSTMMVPFPVLMVPLFSIFRWMGDHTPIQMLGTLRPLWLHNLLGSAFSIFLLRQFYLTIPRASTTPPSTGAANSEFGGESSCHCRASALAVVAALPSCGRGKIFSAR
jgi:ABC-type glycerol-3-phosphate transport system permease component